MRVDIGDVDQPEGRQRFKQDRAQVLTVDLMTLVAQHSVLELTKVESVVLVGDVESVSRCPDGAGGLLKIDPPVQGPFFHRLAYGDSPLAGQRQIAVAASGLSADMVDAVELVEFVVTEECVNALLELRHVR